MAEDEVKKEEFDFTPEGEALGYISLDQARVLAMRTARESPGAYGRRFSKVPMAFEVAEEEDTEDHYVITLDFRPEGAFTGTPGREQFFIEKEGNLAVRQVLSLPGSAGWRRYRLALVAIGLVVVLAAAVGGVLAATGGGGSDDATPLAAASPTNTPERPPPTPSPAPTTAPGAIPPLVTTAIATSLPNPTATALAAPSEVPTPTPAPASPPTATVPVLVPTPTPLPTVPPAATPTPRPTLTPTATPTPSPIANFGDTLAIEGQSDLNLTLLSWQESDWVVNGPYISGYYTFFAPPGMRFVNVRYRFTNVGVRELSTPYLNEGELVVAPQGYYYKVWSPRVGIHTEEYNPRPSTVDEISTVGGDTGAFVTLLPGQSTTGSLTFEIPEATVPVEAQIVQLPIPFSFEFGFSGVPLLSMPTAVPTPTATHTATPNPFATWAEPRGLWQINYPKDWEAAGNIDYVSFTSPEGTLNRTLRPALFVLRMADGAVYEFADVDSWANARRTAINPGYEILSLRKVRVSGHDAYEEVRRVEYDGSIGITLFLVVDQDVYWVGGEPQNWPDEEELFRQLLYSFRLVPPAPAS